jgi:hypothetical protein
MTFPRAIPDVRSMSAEQFAKWQQQPRTCTGPCKRVLTVSRFELTSAYGKPMLRTQCRECMNSYYRSLKVKKAERKAGPR